MQEKYDYNKIVRKNLKIFRKKCGYSQEYLAELVGCSREHLSRLETGKETIGFPTFIKLAKIFKISLDEFAKFML